MRDMWEAGSGNLGDALNVCGHSPSFVISPGGNTFLAADGSFVFLAGNDDIALLGGWEVVNERFGVYVNGNRVATITRNPDNNKLQIDTRNSSAGSLARFQMLVGLTKGRLRSVQQSSPIDDRQGFVFTAVSSSMKNAGKAMSLREFTQSPGYVPVAVLDTQTNSKYFGYVYLLASSKYGLAFGGAGLGDLPGAACVAGATDASVAPLAFALAIMKGQLKQQRENEFKSTLLGFDGQAAASPVTYGLKVKNELKAEILPDQLGAWNAVTTMEIGLSLAQHTGKQTVNAKTSLTLRTKTALDLFETSDQLTQLLAMQESQLAGVMHKWLPLTIDGIAAPSPSSSTGVIVADFRSIKLTTLESMQARDPNANAIFDEALAALRRISLAGSGCDGGGKCEPIPSPGIPFTLSLPANQFFSIQLVSGKIAYANPVTVLLNAQGVLVDEYDNVLDMGVMISPDYQSVTVARSGEINVMHAGFTEVVGQLMATTFVNPAGLASREPGYLVETAASGGSMQGTPGMDPGFGSVTYTGPAAESIRETKNPLDVAIYGRGYFSVSLLDGTLAYTRPGKSFSIDQNGALTVDGLALSPTITIPQGATDFSITKDGLVMVSLASGTTSTAIAQISLALFPNLSGLREVLPNVLVETQVSGSPQETFPGQNGSGYLLQGYKLCD